MLEEMIAVLVSYYGFDTTTAAEILSELRDTKSLSALVGYRGARAVQSEAKQHRP